jgi:hypothetical protein
VLGSGTLNTRWVVTYRIADVPQDRARHRFTLDYQPSPRLQLGIEFNPLVREVGPRATYIVQPETASLPQVHLNTSSDRIGTPKGFQQYSVNIAKRLPNSPLGGYASVTYSEYERGLVFPFGLNYQLTTEIGLIAMNDGRRSHLLATYSQERYFVQLAWIWFRHPGITVGFGF